MKKTFAIIAAMAFASTAFAAAPSPSVCRDAAVYANDAAELNGINVAPATVRAGMAHKLSYVAGTSKESVFIGAVEYAIKSGEMPIKIKFMAYKACMRGEFN